MQIGFELLDFCLPGGISCVIIVNSSELSEKSVSDWLTAQESERYRSFSSKKRKKQFLMGRIAAKSAVIKLEEGIITPKMLNIFNLPNGAPRIEGTSLLVSISHSDDYAVAAAFPHDYAVGIDVEHIRPDKMKALAYFNSPDEPIKQTPQMLTVAWCAKEALGKALLCGLNASPDTFHINALKTIKESEIYSCQYVNHKNFLNTTIILNNNLVVAFTHNQ